MHSPMHSVATDLYKHKGIYIDICATFFCLSLTWQRAQIGYIVELTIGHIEILQRCSYGSLYLLQLLVHLAQIVAIHVQITQPWQLQQFAGNCG